MQEDIIKLAEGMAVQGELACVDAHAIAAQLRAEPDEIGKAVNRASGLRFNRCQLGLFGYGPKAEGKSKIVLKATNIPEEIKAALQTHSANGRIPCAVVWELAERYKYPRLGIANIAEALGLRVAPCQLGCF
jgi:hypothetical protein